MDKQRIIARQWLESLDDKESAAESVAGRGGLDGRAQAERSDQQQVVIALEALKNDAIELSDFCEKKVALSENEINERLGTAASLDQLARAEAEWYLNADDAEIAKEETVNWVKHQLVFEPLVHHMYLVMLMEDISTLGDSSDYQHCLLHLEQDAHILLLTAVDLLKHAFDPISLAVKTIGQRGGQNEPFWQEIRARSAFVHSGDPTAWDLAMIDHTDEPAVLAGHLMHWFRITKEGERFSRRAREPALRLLRVAYEVFDFVKEWRKYPNDEDDELCTKGCETLASFDARVEAVNDVIEKQGSSDLFGAGNFASDNVPLEVKRTLRTLLDSAGMKGVDNYAIEAVMEILEKLYNKRRKYNQKASKRAPTTVCSRLSLASSSQPALAPFNADQSQISATSESFLSQSGVNVEAAESLSAIEDVDVEMEDANKENALPQDQPCPSVLPCTELKLKARQSEKRVRKALERHRQATAAGLGNSNSDSAVETPKYSFSRADRKHFQTLQAMFRRPGDKDKRTSIKFNEFAAAMCCESVGFDLERDGVECTFPRQTAKYGQESVILHAPHKENIEPRVLANYRRVLDRRFGMRWDSFILAD